MGRLAYAAYGEKSVALSCKLGNQQDDASKILGANCDKIDGEAAQWCRFPMWLSNGYFVNCFEYMQGDELSWLKLCQRLNITPRMKEMLQVMLPTI